MISKEGKKRVIITNISPKVEDGKYPVKAVLGEEIKFSASIFGDGHDVIAASVFVKHLTAEKPTEIKLKAINNDCWEASFICSQLGVYEFYIEGWEDHFSNWKNGLKKKYDAGQDINVELQMGTALFSDAFAEIGGQYPKLQKWIAQFEETDQQHSKVEMVLANDIAEIMYNYRPQALITKYPFVYTIEVERKKAAFSTWYELFPRSTSPVPGKHGTFKDVMNVLPRIAKMGFDVLYFPPIHPIGEKNRKGRNNALTTEPNDPGSPWAIGNQKGGHKAIHPQLGSMSDFKRLLKAAKGYGIEIALDIAYQCAPDHPYVKSNPQWFIWRPDGTVQYAENPPKRYEDILPFNFETNDWENLWIELKSIIDFWVDAGVTIFRIDNPHTKAFHFWEWMIKEVRIKNPEIIFLAEAFTRPRMMEQLAKVGFNQSYTYFTWRNTKAELETYLTELTQTELRNYFRPNFWPNTPDILPPALSEGGENAHIQRLILAATLSSNYGIYGPVYEFGIHQPHGKKEEYIDNEKYEIKHWDWSKETRIMEIITRVNKIRKENQALHSTWNIKFVETDNEQLICYVKTDPKTKNSLIIVVNLDVWNTQSGFIQLPLAMLGLSPTQNFVVNDLLSGDQYNWMGGRQYVELNPYLMPAHIFKIENQQ
jgi:starch synthase (maltosyl-transferring)